MQELTQDYTRATTVLKAHDLTVDSPVDNIPPQVQGEVLAVGPDMIEISIGEDDGIKPGHTVVVSRREKYLGSSGDHAGCTRTEPSDGSSSATHRFKRAIVFKRKSKSDKAPKVKKRRRSRRSRVREGVAEVSGWTVLR